MKSVKEDELINTPENTGKGLSDKEMTFPEAGAVYEKEIAMKKLPNLLIGKSSFESIRQKGYCRFKIEGYSTP